MAFWPPETQPDSTPLFVAVKIAREAPLLCSPLEKLADPVFTEDTSPLLVLREHPSPALQPKNAGRTVMDKLQVNHGKGDK
jgi:hypothetical protein